MKAVYTLILLAILISSCTPNEIDVTVSDADVEDTTEETTEGEDTTDNITESDDTTEDTTDNETDVLEDEELSPEEQELMDRILENQETEEENELLEAAGMAKIKIEDIKFKPAEITIESGYTVIWEHNDEYGGSDKIIHQLTIYPPIGSGLKNVRSPRLFLGDTFNHTFEEPGEYWYIDLIFKQNMKGYITVE